MKASLTILKVFLYGFVFDGMYVLYMFSINRHNTIMAGISSILLELPVIFGMLEIVEDKKMAVPYLTGMAAGTMIAMNIF